MILSLIALVSCKNTDKISSQAFDQREQFIIRLLDTLQISDTMRNRFLVVSKHSCSKCLQSILDTISASKIRDSLVVICIGEDQEYPLKMNYLYSRQNIQFAVSPPVTLDELVKQDQFFALNLVCGVIKHGKSYQIFDGLKHTANAYPDADSVSHFLLQE